MLPSQGSAQDIESARAVILVIAAVAAIFWKELLRVLIALIVIAVGIGVFMLLQGMHG
jgi:multisubunit Na+/H+ antiporter MnhC subunit